MELRCHKEIPHSRVKPVRKWNTEPDQFCNDLSKLQLLTNESIPVDTLVQLFEEDVIRCLDKYAPLANKKSYLNENFFGTIPTFKEQKQRLRRRERLWKRYKTADTLKALK